MADDVDRLRRAFGLSLPATGPQIAWHNYLLPVDAEIDKAEDVAKQGVDVDSLLKRLAKAGNAMNVIILDACRENPFAKDFRGRSQGLSQMDAPRSTLLAYATSPGNVASDGGGANGLYTEQLLRELQVDEAKIAEVFKRVRLAVRLKSAGAQVPWESTSLEEDFWFKPPKRLQPLGEEQKQQRFREELTLWESIRGSKDPAPLEAYLRRWPNGHFSELAAMQLDRALARRGEKKIAIASAEDNPFSKGSASADTAYRMGDSYSYRVLDLATRTERRRTTATVTQITDSEVVFDNGLVTDLLGNTLRSSDGRQWHSRCTASTRKGDEEGIAEFDLKIVARERITVPAGSFNAFRIEATGTTQFKTYRTESRVTR